MARKTPRRPARPKGVRIPSTTTASRISQAPSSLILVGPSQHIEGRNSGQLEQRERTDCVAGPSQRVSDGDCAAPAVDLLDDLVRGLELVDEVVDDDGEGLVDLQHVEL